jgi:serine protease Do
MRLSEILQRLYGELGASRPLEQPDSSARPIRQSRQVRTRGWVIVAWLALSVVVGALSGSWMTANKIGLSMGKVEPVYIATKSTHSDAQGLLQKGFADIVKQPREAVVNISSSRITRAPKEIHASPFLNDLFLRQFFGDEFSPWFHVPRERREQSLGSAVIVSPEGYLLTNSHVVEGTTDVRVYLADKRELKARVVGTDPKTDITVLKVEQKNLPTVILGDSSQVEVGDWALAIGNPFGIGQTVTVGVVSATGRGNLGVEDYEDFIQTDAAINPGNSGGALINVRGELIGINTAILSSGALQNQGIGFAIPINMARQVMDQVLKSGKVVHGWLGVSTQEVTPAIATAFKLRGARGALVADVMPNSPAANSGVTKGDIILALNDVPVTDSRELRLKITQTAPGTTVRLKVFREGRERTVSVKLGELPAGPQRASQSGGQSGVLEGIAVEDLTPEIARELELSVRTRGVVVDEVKPGTPAADAGLRCGDVIQELNRTLVTSVADFERAIAQAKNEPVLLFIDRGGSTIFIVVEPR